MNYIVVCPECEKKALTLGEREGRKALICPCLGNHDFIPFENVEREPFFYEIFREGREFYLNGKPAVLRSVMIYNSEVSFLGTNIVETHNNSDLVKAIKNL